MNTFRPYLIIVCMSLALIILPSANKKPKDIAIPCQKEGIADVKYFRASSSAQSKDINNAKEKAIISAKQLLASLIGSTINAVTDNFISSNSTTNNFKQTFESITTEIVNQQIKQVTIVCQQVKRNKNGDFEAFVAVEMPKSSIIDALSFKMEENENLRKNVDKEKFLKTFDEEMLKIENK